MICHPSTSTMLTLIALTSSPASSSSSFDGMASILIRQGRPTAVLRMPSTSSASSKNHSAHHYHHYHHRVVEEDDDGADDDIDLLDALPRELADMILSASAEDDDAPSSTSARKYYPSYDDAMDGVSCATRSARDVGVWETSYDTLRECCEASFGWDYDACMNGDGNGDSNDVDDSDLLDALPRELAALISSAAARSHSPSSSPTLSSLSASGGRGYYPSHGVHESCSSKPTSEFGVWEVRHDTLHACCSESFGWDYDACMNGNGHAVRI